MGERPVGSVGTTEYDRLIALLRATRQRTGITQHALSARLGRSRTYLDKVERGVRRLDVVEFCELAIALGLDPRDLFVQYVDEAFPPARANSPTK